MASRVLIAELKQETATFNPAPTIYDDFRIARADELVASYRGTKTEVSGAIEVFEAEGNIEIVPTMAAAAVSGGAIAANDLDRLLSEFVDATQKVGEVDAAYLCLHGAMAGETEDDPEGHLILEIRKLLGDIPIVVSLDLHAVLTDRMVDTADILVPFHTYPHIDQFETGQRAARNVLRLLTEPVKPTTAHIKLPMLVRGDELITKTGRFGEAIRMCQDIEASTKGLAAGVIIGNAFTDLPALQSHVLVTTNDDLKQAHRKADTIGRFMWDNRQLFQASLVSLENAIQQAVETDGLVVFSDAADATASGASGDSNAILIGLLDSDFAKRALIPMVDAPAVEAAFCAGVNSEIEVDLGGTRDATRFQPVQVRARVKSLHDGDFTYENGTTAKAGRVAVLIVNRIHLLVTERSVYVVGRRVFESHGLDPRDFDLVVVKSPNGFRTWYESIASRIVSVDVPGSTSANLKSLPFQRCVRPIFPLDDVVPSPFE